MSSWCSASGSIPTARLKTLSKGGYAKVGLALALASDPEVLILDEPTSGLDLFIRREFLASMVELAGAGRTILMSSHGIAEVERVASHVGFMAEGRLLLAASIEELRKRIVRVRLRFEGLPPDPDRLGQVLEFETSGRHVAGRAARSRSRRPGRTAATARTFSTWRKRRSTSKRCTPPCWRASIVPRKRERVEQWPAPIGRTR